jgi:hypothetical protein
MKTTDADTVSARPSVRQYSPDDAAYYRDEASGEGWVLFAGVMLAILAVLNTIEGIAAVSTSTFFVNDAKYILSDLNTWGWAMIVLGVVQGLTAIGVWMRVKAVRWVGVTIAALNAIAQMFFLPAYPLLSVMLFTLDILVIYGLIAHGSRTSAAR